MDFRHPTAKRVPELKSRSAVSSYMDTNNQISLVGVCVWGGGRVLGVCVGVGYGYCTPTRGEKFVAQAVLVRANEIFIGRPCSWLLELIEPVVYFFSRNSKANEFQILECRISKTY